MSLSACVFFPAGVEYRERKVYVQQFSAYIFVTLPTLVFPVSVVFPEVWKVRVTEVRQFSVRLARIRKHIRKKIAPEGRN